MLLVGLPDSAPLSVAAHLRDLGFDVVGLACELTAEGASESLLAAALDRWGRLDTVVANAGAALDEPGATSVEALDRMYALHVRSVVELANTAVPVIAESGGGTGRRCAGSAASRRSPEPSSGSPRRPARS